MNNQPSNTNRDVVNVGAKRRRIGSMDMSNSTPLTRARSQTLENMKNNTPQRCQSTPPINITPNRMITRSISAKFGISPSGSIASLLNTPDRNSRSQTASPFGSSVVSRALPLRNDSTSSVSVLSLDSSFPSSSQPGPNSNCNGSGNMSYSGYRPHTPITSTPCCSVSSVPDNAQNHNQDQNHIQIQAEKDKRYIEVSDRLKLSEQRLIQAQQLLRQYHTQNSSLTTSCRNLESRVINAENLLDTKSNELDSSRIQIQQMNFQLAQLHTEKDIINKHNIKIQNELNGYKSKLSETISRFNIEYNKFEQNRKQSNQRIDQLASDSVIKDKMIEDGAKESFRKDRVIEQKDECLSEQSELLTKGVQEIGEKDEMIRRLNVKMNEKDEILKQLGMDLKEKNQFLNDQQKNQATNIDCIIKQNLEFGEKMKDLTDTNEHLKKNVMLSDKTKESLQKVNVIHEKLIKDLKDEVKRDRNQQDEIRRIGWEQLNQSKKEYNILKDKYNSSEAENRNILSKFNQVNDDLIRVKREYEKDKSTWSKEQYSKLQCRETINELKNEMNKLQNNNLSISEEKNRLTRETNQKNRKIEELTQNIISIKGKTDQLQDTLLEQEPKIKSMEEDNLRYKEENSRLLTQGILSQNTITELQSTNSISAARIRELQEINQPFEQEAIQLINGIDKLTNNLFNDDQGGKTDKKRRNLRNRKLTKIRKQLNNSKDELDKSRLIIGNLNSKLKDCNEKLLSKKDSLSQKNRTLSKENQDHKQNIRKLIKFVDRMKFAKSKYQYTDRANGFLSYKSETKSIISLLSDALNQSAGSNDEAKKAIRRLKRLKIGYKLDWLDYWVKLLNFSLTDLGNIAAK
ncbi:uncharacterized protein L201_000341 [Kwoniella dendrophila CBS 6074]|uniref:Centrosomin N-terminal motif 1 domain-containing protein n=1 Tax=Kwoniella dendrophila CBS 6074 TaxID=1295534 RepID=A0AAX4JJ60_9TREE